MNELEGRVFLVRREKCSKLVRTTDSDVVERFYGVMTMKLEKHTYDMHDAYN